MNKIKAPQKNNRHNIVSPVIPDANRNNCVVRFYEYIQHKCWIDNLDQSQGKKIIKLIQQISSNPIKSISEYIWNDHKSVSRSKDNEYAVFSRYFDNDPVEFKIWKEWRVFWFFSSASISSPPAFNILLITSDKHLEK